MATTLRFYLYNINQANATVRSPHLENLKLNSSEAIFLGLLGSKVS